jgi:phenylacetic acid degradation operon negative regulatory protein
VTLQAQSDDQGRVANPASLILFALGAARVPPEPALAGPVLLAILRDLGLSEAAARSAILRMRRGGWLVSVRDGRRVSYRPSEQILAGHQRRARSFSPTGPQWDGAFHALLVNVPERARAFRDEFRRAAQVAGYRTLRAGLLVAPSDRRAELATILDRIPSQASVVPGWLRLSPDDTRRVARDLWSLPELATRYRLLAAAARAAAADVRARPLGGTEAMGAFAAATLPLYQAMADDPGLPADLLPPDWPGQALGAALDDALRAFGPAVNAYLAGLRGPVPKDAE